MEESIKKILKFFDGERIKINEPMSRHTTFRIGGPADFYFEAGTSEEVQEALKLCRDHHIPYLVVGVGANLLVADKGIRGLVIRPMMNQMEVLGPFQPDEAAPRRIGESGGHYKSYDENQYLKFDDLEMAEPPADTLIRVGSGVVLPQLVIWSLEQNLTGLQNFVGIPASIGGCLYNNIHGGTRLFDEFVHELILVDQAGRPNRVPHDEMAFAYDYSRLQKTKETVLEIILKLPHGNIERARRVRLEWLKRKLKVQPQKDCPGCVFKNISPGEAQRIGAPTVAAGWVLDIGLSLKGTRIGGVKISEKHANFFVNDGTGTATDVLALIQICKEKAKKRLDLDLVEEIQMVGEFL